MVVEHIKSTKQKNLGEHTGTGENQRARYQEPMPGGAQSEGKSLPTSSGSSTYAALNGEETSFDYSVRQDGDIVNKENSLQYDSMADVQEGNWRRLRDRTSICTRKGYAASVERQSR